VGIPETIGGENTLDLVYDEVENIFKSLPAKKRLDSEVVRDAIRKGVRNMLRSKWGKKPLCQVAVLEL
jgi:ribonuclease J